MYFLLAEIASQWNSVQRQEFIHGSPIDECQRIQAVNVGNLIFVFDVVQTAGRNHKRRLPMLFRNGHLKTRTASFAGENWARHGRTVGSEPPRRPAGRVMGAKD